MNSWLKLNPSVPFMHVRTVQCASLNTHPTALNEMKEDLVNTTCLNY